MHCTNFPFHGYSVKFLIMMSELIKCNSLGLFRKKLITMILCAQNTHQTPTLRERKETLYIYKWAFSEHQHLVFWLCVFVLT